MSFTLDYYEILGINKSATQEEIKKAYRTLSRKYHPDVNEAANASTMFRLLDEAYTTLYDETKRKEYDINGSRSEPEPKQEQTVDNNFNWNNKSDFDEYIEVKKESRGILYKILILLLKLIGLILIPIVAFFSAILNLISSVILFVGGLIFVIGLIGCAYLIYENGFKLNEIWIPIITSFIGFIMTFLGQRLPCILQTATALLIGFVFSK